MNPLAPNGRWLQFYEAVEKPKAAHGCPQSAPGVGRQGQYFGRRQGRRRDPCVDPQHLP